MFHFKGRKHLALRGLILAVCLCFAYSAQADLTISQTAKASGLGGFLDSETKTVTYIQNDKKCDRTETKMTNKIMKFMGGGKPVKTEAITRIDLGIVWNVDHDRKVCTEMPIQSFGEMTHQWKGQSSGDHPRM